MFFYNTLRALAGYSNSVRGMLLAWGADIRGVWLIGENLSDQIIVLSNYTSLITNRLYTLSDNWLDVYNELKQQGSNVPGIHTLLIYLDDLLSLVRDFAYSVGQVIRTRLPNLHAFNMDPVSYILETLYRYTGLSYSLIHNPIATINTIVNNALGALNEFRANPYQFILSKLTAGNQVLRLLLLSPSMWLQSELSSLFPVLRQFMADPQGYIMDAFIGGLERLTERYHARIIKLAEKIINLIF